MIQRLPIIERAIELARGGKCKTVNAIVTSLKTEAYEHVEDHVYSPSVRKRLREILLEAKP